MMPGLGKKYPIDFEIISKLKEEYDTDEYYASDLPVAPAIVVNGELAIEGGDISEARLEGLICDHLGLEEPEEVKKGILGKIFGP